MSMRLGVLFNSLSFCLVLICQTLFSVTEIYLWEPLMRTKLSGFVNEDEFYLKFVKHSFLCLVCSSMLLLDICHISDGTARLATCVLYCNNPD